MNDPVKRDGTDIGYGSKLLLAFSVLVFLAAMAYTLYIAYTLYEQGMSNTYGILHTPPVLDSSSDVNPARGASGNIR